MRCFDLSTKTPPVARVPLYGHSLWILTAHSELSLLAAQQTACPQGCPPLSCCLCINPYAQPCELLLLHLNPWCIPRVLLCSNAAAVRNFPFLCPCIPKSSLQP